MTRSILILEDDISLGRSLTQSFESKGHRVNLCHLLQTALFRVENRRYDLAIVDVILPDGSGLDLVDYLQHISFSTRILVLTNQKGIKHTIEGLSRGADDCLVKPFSHQELTLRCDKLLTTRKLVSQTSLRLGNIHIYPDDGVVVYNRQKKTLRKKEMDILTCLATHQNQVVTRDTLIDLVWANEVDAPTTATLDVYIRRLRLALGRHRSLIETVRGYGYRIKSQSIRKHYS